MTIVRIAAILIALLSLSALEAAAQGRAFAVEGAGGYAGFADDAIVGHSLVGAAARWYVLPRISIGPEITFMAGEGDHSDLMLTGNITVDLLERRPGRPAIPYLLVGGGLFQTRDTFNGNTFTSSEGGFTAGGGVRVFLGDNFYVAPEFRGGWEPHFRISVSVGYQSH
ncbi:MAG: outer membrane beta-barrel protein [Vicinamibacterales bacterium]